MESWVAPARKPRAAKSAKLFGIYRNKSLIRAPTNRVAATNRPLKRVKILYSFILLHLIPKTQKLLSSIRHHPTLPLLVISQQPPSYPYAKQHLNPILPKPNHHRPQSENVAKFQTSRPPTPAREANGRPSTRRLLPGCRLRAACPLPPSLFPSVSPLSLCVLELEQDEHAGRAAGLDARWWCHWGLVSAIPPSSDPFPSHPHGGVAFRDMSCAANVSLVEHCC